MSKLVGHCITTGLALLSVTDPFTGRLVKALWCLIVVHVVALGGEMTEK